MHPLRMNAVQHMLGISAVLQHPLRVDVGHAGVPALRLAGGPAGHLQALEPQPGGDIDGFLIGPAVQNSGQKTELKHRNTLLFPNFVLSA